MTETFLSLSQHRLRLQLLLLLPSFRVVFTSVYPWQKQQLPPTSPAPVQMNIRSKPRCQPLRQPLCLSLNLPLAALISVLSRLQAPSVSPTAQPLQTLRRLQDQSAPKRASITANLTERLTSDALPDCGPSLCLWLWGIHVSPDWPIPLCRPRSEAAQALLEDAVSPMNTVVENVRLLGWVEKRNRNCHWTNNSAFSRLHQLYSLVFVHFFLC